MNIRRLTIAIFALALIAASCGDSGDTSSTTTVAPDDTTTSTAAPATSTSAQADDQGLFSDEGRTLDAPAAAITVDGDDADWADVAGLDMTLVAIADEDFESKDATVKVAHDADYLYVLFQVEDDYDWLAEDKHLSAAAAVQWSAATGAGEAMGATDADRLTSLGLVDIWHWELNCAAGVDTGGAVSGPGADNSPGNDDGCNFDDEFATQTEERHDDGGDGAENTLLGVWSHTSSTIDADGTWTFEMMRPLQTGDAQDAQFEVGSSADLALAYWDADSGPDGWSDEYHVVSANQGWITVNFI